MGDLTLHSTYFLLVLCYLTCAFAADHETFVDTTVQWCNASTNSDHRVCEVTKISHSNSLAANIPADHRDFTYITISQQHIPVIYENSVANMDIDLLEIDSSGVTDIEAGAFNNVSLSSLSITSNNIEKLSKGIFKDLSVQQQIRLAANGIKEIDEEIFGGLTFSTLDLSKNSIEQIKPGVFKNLNVEFISLSGNKLNSVDRSAFQNLEVMQLLDLSENKISSIQPDAFRDMRTPAFVYLFDNLLEAIPEGIFNNTVFVELLLNGNSIKSISSGAFRDTAFQFLNLTRNKLETIESGIFDDTAVIYTLDLSKNSITTIAPHALDKVVDAVELNSNNIGIIKKDTFNYVQSINLLKNKKLKKIEVGAFADDSVSGYGRKPQVLYLEKDNMLDEASKDYLNKMVKLGHLIWNYNM